MIDYEILQDIITDHELCKVQENELAKVVELLKADRLIELPCKVGDYVYKIHSDNWKECFKGNGYPLKVVMSVFMYKDIPHFGKLVFTTKEEAEAKLAELKGDKA